MPFSDLMLIRIIWIVLVVLFGVLEAFTISLTLIWFSVGALAAFFVSFLTTSLFAQIMVFGIVSVVLLFISTKFFIRRDKEENPAAQTNSYAIVGKTGIVKRAIEPNDTGIVRVDNEDWTAISVDNLFIPAGSQVIIEQIVGVKLVVGVLEEN